MKSPYRNKLKSTNKIDKIEKTEPKKTEDDATSSHRSERKFENYLE